MPADADLRDAAALAGAVGATGLLGDGAAAVLVLCSAGRDSACLLDLAVAARGAACVHVLHVDHGLRGPGAAADDAAMVGSWCEEAGVALTVLAAQTDAAPTGDAVGNVHAWARGERRRLAADVAGQVGAERVLVAHTRTDLVETALARLATQPGRRALLAMRAHEGPVARPLLAAGVTRLETEAYCRERAIPWLEDPSNTDRSFARARVRHDVLPVLRSLNPRAEEAVARTLAELAEESTVLDALVDLELAPGPEPSVALERLAALPAALGRLVLRELCERALGAPCPRAASRLDDVLALGTAAARQGSGAVDVGGGARVELRGGLVRCRRSAGSAAPD